MGGALEEVCARERERKSAVLERHEWKKRAATAASSSIVSTNSQAYRCTHAHTPTHTHALTHSRTHSPTHAIGHTHPHLCQPLQPKLKQHLKSSSHQANNSKNNILLHNFHPRIFQWFNSCCLFFRSPCFGSLVPLFVDFFQDLKI